MRADIVSPVNVNIFLLFKKHLLLILLFCLSMLVSGCSDALNDSHNEKDKTLYVKFINSAVSEYTITRIELQAMGRAGEPAKPSGVWSDNILENGQKLAPGEFDFLTLDIPSLNYSIYRIGVENATETELMLHTQENYQGIEPTITHWGSDERTVEVTVSYDESTNQIQVKGWSDWAGID